MAECPSMGCQGSKENKPVECSDNPVVQQELNAQLEHLKTTHAAVTHTSCCSCPAPHISSCPSCSYHWPNTKVAAQSPSACYHLPLLPHRLLPLLSSLVPGRGQAQRECRVAQGKLKVYAYGVHRVLSRHFRSCRLIADPVCDSCNLSFDPENERQSDRLEELKELLPAGRIHEQLPESPVRVAIRDVKPAAMELNTAELPIASRWKVCC